jgi:hypothetical protein
VSNLLDWVAGGVPADMVAGMDGIPFASHVLLSLAGNVAQHSRHTCEDLSAAPWFLGSQHLPEWLAQRWIVHEHPHRFSVYAQTTFCLKCLWWVTRGPESWPACLAGAVVVKRALRQGVLGLVGSCAGVRFVLGRAVGMGTCLAVLVSWGGLHLTVNLLSAAWQSVLPYARTDL